MIVYFTVTPLFRQSRIASAMMRSISAVRETVTHREKQREEERGGSGRESKREGERATCRLQLGNKAPLNASDGQNTVKPLGKVRERVP